MRSASVGLATLIRGSRSGLPRTQPAKWHGSMGAVHGIGKDEAGRFSKGRTRNVLGNGEPRKADDRAAPVATWAGEPGTGGAVVFRGAQTLSCTVIVCIEAFANHGGRRMDGFGRMGGGRVSLRRGADL